MRLVRLMPILGPAILAGLPAAAQAPAAAELFVVANAAAGIDAPHRSAWDEFTSHVPTSGYLGIGQAWGDYDNDGWLDLFLAASGYAERFRSSTGSVGLLLPYANVLFRNRGYGNYVDVGGHEHPRRKPATKATKGAQLTAGREWHTVFRRERRLISRAAPPFGS